MEKHFGPVHDKKEEVINLCEHMHKELKQDSHDLAVSLAINSLKTKDFEQLTEHMQDLEWADAKELYYLMAFKQQDHVSEIELQQQIALENDQEKKRPEKLIYME